MNKEMNPNQRRDDDDAPSRPGPKTFAAAVMVGVAVVVYYNWTAVISAFDFV